MSRDVELLVSDPEARVVETEAGTWLLSGVDPGALERAVSGAERPRGARDALCTVAEDAIAVCIVADTGRPRSVTAYRSATATRELYYLDASDGQFVLADGFRNALSRLGVEDRSVPRRTIADHLLFRKPIEPDTYVSAVSALEPGGWLRWDATTDEVTTRQVDRLSVDPTLDPGRAHRAIGQTLDDLISRGTRGEVATMFSGGVDSTLLQTYLDAPMVTMEIDSPELAFEREYVEQSRTLLGDQEHRRLPIDEAAFLDHLEASMDLLGFPSHFAQTVLTHVALADGDADRYVNGEGADALFGLSGSKGARIASWLSPLASQPGVARLAAHAPNGLDEQLSELCAVAAALDRPVSDPSSFAQQFAFFTDPEVVAEMVGEELVSQRYRAQYDYVTDRVDSVADGRFAQQLELGHLLSFFQHNTPTQWRQLAHAHGATLFTPFKTGSLARCALSVPAERRYVQGLRGARNLEAKYLLKRLLDSRLPAYPTGQEKGAGALPIGRFLDSGALADVFEQYDPPTFVPESMHDDHVDSYGPVTWNLVTYAVWRERVLTDPELDTVPGTQRYAWSGRR